MKPLIVFYDGYCLLCNYWVQKLCRWDKKDRLRFALLTSTYAKQMEFDTNFNLAATDSVLVWDQKSTPLAEAEGLFAIIQSLGGVWKILLFFKVFPLSVLNFTYRIFAKKRYRWFGELESCPLPKADCVHKFLR